MYEGLKVNFWLWHIVGGVYGYKELIRLPRKQKKALKKSILQDIITVDRTYVKECPRPKKLPTFSYKQIRKEPICLSQKQKPLPDGDLLFEVLMCFFQKRKQL